MNTLKIVFMRVALIAAMCLPIVGGLKADTMMPNFTAAIQGGDYFSLDRVANGGGANHIRTHSSAIWDRSFAMIPDGEDPAMPLPLSPRAAMLTSASAGAEKHAASSALKNDGDEAKNADKSNPADGSDSTVGFADIGVGMAGGGWSLNPWFGGLPVHTIGTGTTSSATTAAAAPALGTTASGTSESIVNLAIDADPTIVASALDDIDGPASAVPEASSCVLLGLGLIMVTCLGLRYRRYHPI
jgi:hypothetical protein